MYSKHFIPRQIKLIKVSFEKEKNFLTKELNKIHFLSASFKEMSQSMLLIEKYLYYSLEVNLIKY